MQMAAARQAWANRPWPAWLFLAAVAGLLYLAYPLALLPPAMDIAGGINNLPFHVGLPGVLVAGLLAVPVIVGGRGYRLPWLLVAGVGVFLAMLGLNGWRYPQEPRAALTLLGYVTIPWAVAVARHTGALRFRPVVWALFGLWALQLVHYPIAHFRGQPVVGTAGNVNWEAALVLALAPWAYCGWLAVWDRLTHGRRPEPRVLVALLLTAVPTLGVLWACQCRASVVALLLLGAVFAFVACPRPGERLLLALLLAVAGSTVLLLGVRLMPDRFIRSLQADVRLPLTAATVRLIRDQPWGSGAGQFRKAFAPYRATSTYHERLVAANTTIHPHNELLNLAAQLGLPAALAFLLLLLPLVTGDHQDAYRTAARFSAVALVAHGLLDMPLVQPPTDLLALCCLGLCWPLRPRPPAAATAGGVHWRPAAALAVLAPTLVLAGWLTTNQVRFALANRRGELARLLGVACQQRGDSRRAQQCLGRAYAAFAAAAAIDPRAIEAVYEAGRAALGLPGRLADAERYLGRVAGTDPNFAHVNSLLARALLTRGQGRPAAEQLAVLDRVQALLIQECRLYPSSAEAYQTFLAFCIGRGQYDRVPAVYEHLSGIYRQRAQLRFPGAALATQLRAWATAVAQGDRAGAVARARELTQDLEVEALDPLFVELSAADTAWCTQILRLGYTELDAGYWQHEFALRQTLREIGGGQLPPLPALVEWVAANTTIEPGLDILQLPGGYRHARRGSALSAYVYLAGLVANAGGWCVLQLDAQGAPTGALAFNRDREAFLVDLPGRSCVPLPPDDPRRRLDWQPGRTVIYFPFEAYFLRTQALGNLYAAQFPADSFLPTRPPSMHLIFLRQLTGAVPQGVTLLKDYCLAAPVAVYRQAFLEARGAGRPRPPVPPPPPGAPAPPLPPPPAPP